MYGYPSKSTLTVMIRTDTISGTGTMSRPLPRSTTTCVLSIITRVVAPPMKRSASVRNTLQSKRRKFGTLEEQYPRIAKHCRCGLHFPFPAAQFELVGGRVVLNLFTRRERILARRRG